MICSRVLLRRDVILMHRTLYGLLEFSAPASVLQPGDLLHLLQNRKHDVSVYLHHQRWCSSYFRPNGSDHTFNPIERNRNQKQDSFLNFLPLPSTPNKEDDIKWSCAISTEFEVVWASCWKPRMERLGSPGSLERFLNGSETAPQQGDIYLAQLKNKLKKDRCHKSFG